MKININKAGSHSSAVMASLSHNTTSVEEAHFISLGCSLDLVHKGPGKLSPERSFLTLFWFPLEHFL